MPEKISPLIQAIDLSGNKFVQACAGAGKTFALSKRYCAILDSFAAEENTTTPPFKKGPANILVITFTNKAAAEMSQRIYEDLNNLLKGIPVEPFASQNIPFGTHISKSSPAYMEFLKSSFSDNRITTIDSFCASVLRSNAHLINLDPKFKLEEEILSERYFAEALDHFLKLKNQNKDPRLETALQYASPNKILQFIGYLYKNRIFMENNLRKWKQFIDRPVKDIINDWIEFYTPMFPAEQILDELSSLLAFKNHIKKQSDRAFLLLEKLEKQLHDLPVTENKSLHRLNILEIIKQNFITGRLNYTKRIPGAATNWDSKETISEFKEKTADLINFLSETIPAENFRKIPNASDFKAVPLLKAVADLYADFAREMDDLKSERNYLEFNDVILKTRNLLRDFPEVTAQLQKQFPHIMIDEFQDTNDVRWEIVKLLSTDPNGQLRRKGLFIVGDKKQSIYRFNQADVEVMNRARKVMISSEKNQQEVLIDFNDNYRSSEKFIRTVINPVFSRLMPNEEDENILPYEATFSPTSFPEGNSADKDIKDPEYPICEINLVNDIDNSEENKALIAALNAAKTAESMLHWAERNDLTKSGKPVIGVLLRSFSNIHYYIKTFQEISLPFTIESGRKFFKQQEIYDIYHFIAVILNPHDNQALTGLMRSPFLALSDPEIEKAATLCSDEQSLLDSLQTLPETADIYSTILKWQQQISQKNADEVIYNILFNEGAVFSYYDEINAPGRIANIEKMLNYLHELFASGTSLYGVYDILKYQIENNENHPQADLPGKSLISIMTIHKAKGLEFPAVIIPECAAPLKANPSSIIHGKLAKANGGDSHFEIGVITDEQENTNLLNHLKNTEKNEILAEDLRLFYVAVTRARYRIAFTAEYNDKPKGSSWLQKYITTGLQLEPQWEQTNKTTPHPGIFLNIYSAATLTEQSSHTSPQELLWSEPSHKPSAPVFMEITPHDIMDNLSPSLELPETYDRISNLADDEAITYGVFFHRYMELNLWNQQNAIEAGRQLLQKEFAGNDENKMLKQLQQQLKLFKDSSLFEIFNSQSITQKFAELPVYGWFNNTDAYLQISGIIDLLYYYRNKWYVLDYKTDSDTGRLPLYRIQLQIYLHMVKQCFNIDATGQIYFASAGKLQEVPMESDFLNKIYPELGGGFTYSDIDDTPNEQLATLIKAANGNTVILNPTRSESFRIIRGLINGKIFKPEIKIATLPEIIRHINIDGKKLSPHQHRLIVKKYFQEKVHTKGLISILAEELKIEEEWKCGLKEPYGNLPEEIENLKRQGDWKSDPDIIQEGFFADIFKDKQVIVNGFYRLSPTYFNALRTIASKAAGFSFIDNFDGNKIKNDFVYNHHIWEKMTTGNLLKESGQKLYICPSIKQEVEFVAQMILKEKNPFSQIKIAVSNAKEYLPRISQIFSAYGIPYRTAVKTPVTSLPFTGLILDFLKLINPHDKITVEKVAAVFLHPLMKKHFPTFGKCHLRLRKNGLEEWNTVSEIFAKDQLPDCQIVKEINRFISRFRLTPPSSLFDISRKLNLFTDIYGNNLNPQNSRLEQNGINAIKSIIKNIPLSFKLINLPGTYEDYLTEFINRLHTTELSGENYRFGCEITGFMDTIGLKYERLFIMGFNEGYIPPSPPFRPHLNHIPFLSRNLNILFFRTWQTGKDKVIYTAPLTDNSGKTLKISVFAEYLQQEHIATASDLSDREITAEQHYARYYRKLIKCKTPSRRIERHNGYLQNTPSVFKGYTGPHPVKKLTLSSNWADDLLKCPMRYWFSRILKLEEIDFNAAKQTAMIKGVIIHDALAEFGEKNGFALNLSRPEEAEEMLASVLGDILRKRSINLQDDLLASRLYQPYLSSTGKLGVVLKKMLQWNRENLSAFRQGKFEQTFGENLPLDTPQIQEGSLTLNFTGRIDKILFDDGSERILATDYKTGDIDPKSIIDFYSSQFFIYYLILKHNYPDKHITFSYEIINNEHESRLAKPFGDTEKDNTEDNFTVNNETFSLSEVKRLFLRYARKVAEGRFHITDRDTKKACRYCPYEKICRKDSLFK